MATDKEKFFDKINTQGRKGGFQTNDPDCENEQYHWDKIWQWIESLVAGKLSERERILNIELENLKLAASMDDKEYLHEAIDILKAKLISRFRV